MGKKISSQAKLKKNVLEQSLCTGCGACVGLCPYQVIYADRTVQLFDCDLQDGKCHAFCPRTPANYDDIRQSLFPGEDITAEIGAISGFYLTRATDPALRAQAQHGGTVSALLRLAMHEGLIDAAIVSGQNDDFEQEGQLVEDAGDLIRHAGSRFTVSPTVASFNALQEGRFKTIGVVATPCQALALAKMKTTRIEGYEKAQSIALVIGLLCGWTLSVEKFQHLLSAYHLTRGDLTGMDIPAGKNILELKTKDSIIDVPLPEIDACIREACRYCVDSTAEFADLSVGAARYGGDLSEMAGWNQVIVRSRAGRQLIELAREKGVLEVLDAPAQALISLKLAAAEKKKKALKNIVAKSGSAKNLLYLNAADPLLKKRKRKS